METAKLSHHFLFFADNHPPLSYHLIIYKKKAYSKVFLCATKMTEKGGKSKSTLLITQTTVLTTQTTVLITQSTLLIQEYIQRENKLHRLKKCFGKQYPKVYQQRKPRKLSS